MISCAAQNCPLEAKLCEVHAFTASLMERPAASASWDDLLLQWAPDIISQLQVTDTQLLPSFLQFITILASKKVLPNANLEFKPDLLQNNNTTLAPPKNGCGETACGKRRLPKEEFCLEHSMPALCLVEKCSLKTSEGLGVCESHKEGLVSKKARSNRGAEDICAALRCYNKALKDAKMCSGHVKRVCQVDGCLNLAHRKGKCKGHGGIDKCSIEGCEKGARGKTGRCMAHGGGKRCKMNECNNGAVASQGLCRKHGGGKRCEVDGCSNSASGSTLRCKKHGGGKKCLARQCEKPAHTKSFCYKHFHLTGISTPSEAETKSGS